jgi:hypothetical protein
VAVGAAGPEELLKPSASRLTGSAGTRVDHALKLYDIALSVSVQIICAGKHGQQLILADSNIE